MLGQYCGYIAPRDVVSAEVIRNRGLIAVGHTVNENACGEVLTGFSQSNLTQLVKCL